jgi:hypothetical protein
MECGYIWEQQTGLYCNGISPSSQKVPGALNYNPNAKVNNNCEQCVFGCMVGSSTHPKINSNYDPGATCDDGSCIPCIYGCTNNGSPNYNGEATCDDGSCIGVVNGCTDPTACNYSSLATMDDGSCLTIYGCMDPTATNYREAANCNDSSCAYCIYGCTDSEATNYNSLATCNNYTCIYPTTPSYTYGCMDPEAYNYNPSATIDDGSCIAVVYGCTNLTATNYNPLANTDDGSCIAVVYGCRDPLATNYNLLATVDDGSCVYGVAGRPGCIDRDAANYNPNATIDDGSCVYESVGVISGCMDPEAANYNPLAVIDDGSCEPVSTSQIIYGCIESTQFNYAGENNPNSIDPPANEACSGPTPTNYGGSGCLPPHCTGPWVPGSEGCCEPIVYGCIDCGTIWESNSNGCYCNDSTVGNGTCGSGSAATTLGAFNHYAAANTNNNNCTLPQPCPQAVSSVYTASVTTTSATIGWTFPATTTNSAAVTTFQVDNHTLGTLGCNIYSVTPGESYECGLTGLSPGTTYVIAISTNCANAIFPASTMGTSITINLTTPLGQPT